MADVRTAWAPDSWPYGGDWLVDPPGLAADHDLETACLLSLLTEASAAPDDVLPDFSGDRRGWWGNWQRPEGIVLGSRLWLLVRSVSTDETLQQAQAYAEEALAWLVDGSIAAQVDVSAAYLDTPPSQLGLTITITRGPTPAPQYAWVWDQLAAEGVAPQAVTITVGVSAAGVQPLVGGPWHAL
jgi:phage gp46-like protein